MLTPEQIQLIRSRTDYENTKAMYFAALSGYTSEFQDTDKIKDALSMLGVSFKELRAIQREYLHLDGDKDSDAMAKLSGTLDQGGKDPAIDASPSLGLRVG